MQKSCLLRLALVHLGACGNGASVQKISPVVINVQPLQNTEEKALDDTEQTFYPRQQQIPDGFAVRFFYLETSRFNLYGLPIECESKLDRVKRVLLQPISRAARNMADSENVAFQLEIVDFEHPAYWFVECVTKSDWKVFGKIFIISPQNINRMAQTYCELMYQYWKATEQACLYDDPIPIKEQNDFFRAAFQFATFPNENPHLQEEFATIVY